MNAVLWASLAVGVMFWTVGVGALLYAVLFKLGVESSMAVRLGYTIGAVLSWIWVFLIPVFPGTGTALASHTAFWTGAPWPTAVIAFAPGALFALIAWVVRP